MKISKTVRQVTTIVLSVAGLILIADLAVRLVKPTAEQEQQQVINKLEKMNEAIEKEKEHLNNRPNQANITLAQFNQLQNGMSYEQVKAILKSEGTLTYSFQLGKNTSDSYSFAIKGSPFANVSLVFQNNQLVSKSQYGLE